jgi:dTDP-4-dehydrorhamnose reductase
MIGRELSHFQSLLEWSLRQKSRHVEGFTRAMYSGLTTNFLAATVGDVIHNFPKLSGLYQITGRTISKFELLKLIQQRYKLPVEVVPDEMVHCDRSMIGDKFRDATGFEAPGWPKLIDELASDPTPYPKWTGELS